MSESEWNDVLVCRDACRVVASSPKWVNGCCGLNVTDYHASNQLSDVKSNSTDRCEPFPNARLSCDGRSSY